MIPREMAGMGEVELGADRRIGRWASSEAPRVLAFQV